MMVRRLTTIVAFVIGVAGCATTTAQTSARPSAYACSALDPSLSHGAVFDGPLTVVEAKRVYRYEGRAQRRIPEGVAIHVRATPGLSAPDIHRIVACRMHRGAETRIGVRPRGATWEVTVKSRVPAVAREIQAEHAPRADG